MDTISYIFHSIGGNSVCNGAERIVIAIITVCLNLPCGYGLAAILLLRRAALGNTGLIDDMAQIMGGLLIAGPIDLVICPHTVGPITVVNEICLIDRSCILYYICLSVLQCTGSH